jgi:UDP-N-acetylglucosamine enolpyruvyl transferase
MAKNPAMELMITVMLHKMDDNEWSEEELSPIKDIKIMDITPAYSALGATITLRNNEKYEIDFKDIDGERTC